MTDRDLRFADEYMIDCDAKNAAIRAGYSVSTAKNASAWIRLPNPEKPQLRALIDRRLAEMSRRTGATAERVMQELGKIAFADVSDVVDPETGMMLQGAQRTDTAAVAGIRVKRGKGGTEYEVKMCDKIRALELIGKMLNMFTDTVQIAGGLPVIVDDSGENEKDG